ncbi:DUF3302 domain-containing protein [Falsihalocynthiibacter arcticus]|nr:DUF3302 domain-containing protein [Falsihalocynthiibacter arcticus]
MPITLLNYVSRSLISFLIVGIVVVHEIPGKVAKARNHPQLDAIKISSYLGLLVFPLWILALIRAHFRPWTVSGLEGIIPKVLRWNRNSPRQRPLHHTTQSGRQKMEFLVTIAYLFLIRLFFFDFKWLKFNLVWGLLCSGLHTSAALVEVAFIGQLTPYSDSAFVQRYAVQIGPQFCGTVTEVHVKQDDIVKLGGPLFSLEKDTFQAMVDESQARLVLAKQNIKIM